MAAPDSGLLAGAVQAARQRYRTDAPESRLLNGVAYVNHASGSVQGRPFFQSSEPQPGTLDYDGQHFVDVPLLYEQVQDHVLLYGPAQAEPLQLVRQKVQAFELAGHRFVRLPADSTGLVAEGFYDLVVDGPAQLLSWLSAPKRCKRPRAVTASRGSTKRRPGSSCGATTFFTKYSHSYDGLLGFTTYQENLQGFPLDPRALLEKYEAMQGQREFFAPRYASTQQQQSPQPDRRNPLHWQPTVTLSPGATQELTFYTSDQVGRYLMVVQGLAADSQAGSTSTLLEVKSAL